MEQKYSIEEILSAVNEIQNKKKEKKTESKNNQINEAKNNEKIKMLLETFDDANLINVQKEDE